VFPTVSSSVFAAVPNDDFITFLSEISGKPVPMKYRRQRGQLVDAMLDAHFHIGGRKLAIGAEPDLLFDVSSMLHEMGAKVAVAVTTTESPVLARVATDDVLIGDLEDLETLSKERGCDLMITHSMVGKGRTFEDPFLSYGTANV